MTRKNKITAIEEEKIVVSSPDSETDDAHPRPAHSVAELTFGAILPRKRPEDFRALREAFTEVRKFRNQGA
jgi:hypothetical protein